MSKASVSLRWLGVLVLACLVGAYAAFLAVKPTPADRPAVAHDDATLRVHGGDVPSSVQPGESSMKPMAAPDELLAEADTTESVASQPPQGDLGSVHAAVRRMSADALMVSSFQTTQATGAHGRRPSSVQDLTSSAVMPFGLAPVEPVPAAATERRTRPFDPMQPNPALAAITRQAQRDLTTIVESLQAVEGSAKP